MAPQTPAAGAGIATLNPLPEVPRGDVDLIAPLGTIDPGEAGVRSSGNVNVAALHVVNAANIQAQGNSSGVPVTAAVNTSALSSASAASGAAAASAKSEANRSRNAARQSQPSIISVQILGFGNEGAEGATQTPAGGSGPARASGAARRRGALCAGRAGAGAGPGGPGTGRAGPADGNRAAQPGQADGRGLNGLGPNGKWGGPCGPPHFS
ncbi:filamentous hemagglutinin family protein [Achromobacter xylosoxidans]